MTGRRFDRFADVEVARETVRDTMRDRFSELRETWLSVLQVGVSAAVAYLLARELLGHEQPFFAAVAAILTLSLAVGQRGRRAIEIAIGVALGIGVADLIVLLIGSGVWQLAVVVSLAVAAAVLAGGGVLLVNQAAVSAVLVVTLQPPDTAGLSIDRFVDAILGGVVALAANAITPAHPIRMVRRRLAPLSAELAATLDGIAEALTRGDAAAAAEALERARGIDPLVARFHEAVVVAGETIRMAPSRRVSRERVRGLTEADIPLDHAVRNVRVLARGALRATELGERVPAKAIDAIRDLAIAVREIADCLSEGSHESETETERAALSAASKATAALEDTSNLSASVIVGQVRSTATDLLESLGLQPSMARDAVRSPTAILEGERPLAQPRDRLE
ncbi:aromatic acid exporter family protein [Thermoleophilia bacterium SCSIO 60948]|nr:aromatic acid exporter family protein [Thermoleophilia bacterium SCSIO 60948]